MAFVKGQSGNPSGRPVDEFAKMLRADKGLPDKLLKTTKALLNSKNEAIRLKAAEFLADRAFGKATQSIDANVTGNVTFRQIIYKDGK